MLLLEKLRIFSLAVLYGLFLLAAECSGQVIDRTAFVGSSIAALSDRSWWVRTDAAAALEKLRDPSLVPSLISALRDRDPFVRETAARVLGNIGDPRAVEALTASGADKNRMVRWACDTALGRIAAVTLDISNLKNAGVPEKRKAAENLGKNRVMRAQDALIAAMRDSDVKVREAALKALVQIEGPMPVEALTAALVRHSVGSPDQEYLTLSALTQALNSFPPTQIIRHKQNQPAILSPAENASGLPRRPVKRRAAHV